MKRIKAHIAVVVFGRTAAHPDNVQIAAEQALLYADTVSVVHERRVEVALPDKVHRITSPYPPTTRDFRTHAWDAASHSVDTWENPYIVLLEGTQRFAEPENVRDIIEFNVGNVVYGTRYFMWTDTEYRADSYYRPAQQPIAVPWQDKPTWRDPMDTFPWYAYSAAMTGYVTYADLDILDYRYTDPEFRMEDGSPQVYEYS